MFPDLNDFPLLSAYLRAENGDPGAINTTIHPNDEMLQHVGDSDQQDLDHLLVHYFRTGQSMCSTIEQIARWRFGSFHRVSRLLDFASGYGRLTRFLVRKIPRERITIAEINAEAVDFQVQQFNVEGLPSVSDPAGFVCEKRFDVIFVASLFTHLPQETFGRWLERLWSLLNPRGVLLFSVHGQKTFSYTGQAAAEGHFVYDASPHSRCLDPAEYGNTYVSDAFLAESIGDRSFIRLKRGLMNFQDLCVAVPEVSCDFSTLAYDSGAEGRLDILSVGAEGKVDLCGWVASRYVPLVRLEIRVGDALIGTVSSFYERRDVEAFHGEGAYLWSGWQFSFNLDDFSLSLNDIVTVWAITRTTRSLLFIATIGTAAFRSRYGEWVRAGRNRLLDQIRDAEERHQREREVLQQQRDGLQQHIDRLEAYKISLEEGAAALQYDKHVLETRIRAMEASRFWKMRNHWFRFKRRIGLTSEE